MGALLDLGPQSPRTYWIRRGAVVLAAALLLWGLFALFTPKNDAVVAVPSVTPSVSATLPSPSVSVSASASASPSVSASASPTGPVACDPLNVEVDLAGFRSVAVGSKQPFKVTVGNNTAVPCILDLKTETFALKVVSGTDRIWSTADCPKLVPAKKTTLKAGKAYEFTIEWPGKRSQPGCTLVDKDLGVGTYVATASYQDTATGRFVMTLAAKKK